jgi:hypothetical protein
MSLSPASLHIRMFIYQVESSIGYFYYYYLHFGSSMRKPLVVRFQQGRDMMPSHIHLHFFFPSYMEHIHTTTTTTITFSNTYF